MDQLSSESRKSNLPEQGLSSSGALFSNAGATLHEDVLTHLTKSAVQSVSNGLHLGLSEETSTNVSQWITGVAKTVPLFVPGGGVARTIATYGSAAALYGISETKWGDSTDNLAKDALLGGLKGIGMKGSMDLIGRGVNSLGLESKFWAAPATGVAFGASSTLIETGLSRSTYHDAQGNYRGIEYGIEGTAKAVGNIENLVTGAATFTLGAGVMKGLQLSPIASKFPELIGSRVFQNTATGFSFGAFSGMAEEARRQAKEGNFEQWQLNKLDYGKIGTAGLFEATSFAAGAALGAKLGPRPVPVEAVPRINQPADQTITSHDEIAFLVESPLRKAVASLYDKNIQTVGSGVSHGTEPQWSPMGYVVDVGEYEPPYYKFSIGKDGRYRDANLPLAFEGEQTSETQKQVAFIRLNDLKLSEDNQRIARELGRPRYDTTIEVSVPAVPGTPSDLIEKQLLELTTRFQPQPLTWGFKTPQQFYYEELNINHGTPTQEWLTNTVNSAEFKERGLLYDPHLNLIFESEELAQKYQASPPPEPTWYRGPEIIGAHSRGGLRLSYMQSAVHLYTPEGQHIERADPASARIPARGFDIDDLVKPENADYYLANKNRFFELFGSKAYDWLADRHWLELRKGAFESVESHWPVASIEKDRATLFGTAMLARASAGIGHLDIGDAGRLEQLIPRYLWRDPTGRFLNPAKAIDLANRVYDDMDQARQAPFDHTFARSTIDRVNGADADAAVDRYQLGEDRERNLEQILTTGWSLQVHPKYTRLLQEIEQQQRNGFIPERFDKSTGDDGLVDYKPVYREATAEERTVPLSELVKNLKIVDFGFGNKDEQPILGKISLASHDIHDHARAFRLLQLEGLFDEATAERPGYRHLMDKLTDPLNTGIFKREGELVASVAYDMRSFYELTGSYQPQIELGDIRKHFLWADSRGVPLSPNQARAVDYLEHLIVTDPQSQSLETKRLRHILGGVWQETLEQKRKTENTLWQRSDGTFQRMSAVSPEYLAFVIDATRILHQYEPDMLFALNRNNLKMEAYLRSVATQPDQSSVPELHFTPEDIADLLSMEPIDLHGVPNETVNWLMRHPGFNTRRAPIRHWLTELPERHELEDALTGRSAP